MEYRVIRVGGWEFQIQVLPEVKVLNSKWVGPGDIGLRFAEALAIKALDD